MAPMTPWSATPRRWICSRTMRTRASTRSEDASSWAWAEAAVRSTQKIARHRAERDGRILETYRASRAAASTCPTCGAPATWNRVSFGPMSLASRIITSSAYEADIGAHVFPTEKFRGVLDRLTAEDGLSGALEPHEPTREDLLRVHTAEYLDDLDHCRWTERTAYSELPISSEIVRWFRLSCGGTILAARQALDLGWAAHLGGGFHHA